MAHYVLSDVHGEADRFMQMIQKISLGQEDILYILGDVVDRGPNGVELLNYIRSQKTMVMLMGNHEHMLLRYYSPDVTDAEIRRWNRNCNTPTKEGMLRLSEQERQSLFEWIASLPTHLEVQVAGKKYYLVHGFPGENLHDEVWGRPEPTTPNPVEGCRLIVGHTPVSCVGKTDEEEEAYIQALTQLGQQLQILHTPGYIDLDCCCGYSYSIKRLACLRLEDGAEFYC